MRHRTGWLVPAGAATMAVALGVAAVAGSGDGTGRRVIDQVDGHALPAALRTTEVRCRAGVVASAALEASQAGARILEAGGNAVDAAVAAAFALGVAEPAASGLGGQTYLLIQLAGGRAVAIDGSATVPTRVNPVEVASLSALGVRADHRFVAVPGSVAALAHALRRFGTMSLREVVAPAVELATFGNRLTVTEHVVAGYQVERLRASLPLARVFLDPDLELWPGDHVYCNDRLAATLRRLAAGGDADFYRGAIAAEIAADMEANGGWVSRADLARVRARELSPLRGRYRGHEVIAFPAPGGGGAVIEALQILDALPAGLLATPGIDRAALLAESVRVALIDGYWGDTPLAARTAMQVDPGHAQRRASHISAGRPVDRAQLSVAGQSPWRQQGTTQVSVIDAAGNAVSVTQTLAGEFGAVVATPSLGFPYNSLLDVFASDRPESPAYLQPNRTPETTMAPTMILHEGRPWLVLGGAGSGRLTSTIVETVSNVIDRRLSVGEAVAAPRVLWDYSQAPRYMLELAGPHDDAGAERLAGRGFQPLYRLHFPPDPIDLLAFGGVNAALRDPATGALAAAADPRRNGGAAGPCRP